MGRKKSGRRREAPTEQPVAKKKSVEYENVVGQDSLTRFDTEKKQGKNPRRKQLKPRLNPDEKPRTNINLKKQ